MGAGDILDVPEGGSPNRQPPAPRTGVPSASASSSHFIAEERSSKKYFSQIPNLYDDAGLTVYEFRLLVHYVRVGNCFESTQTTAKNCGMSVGSVVKARGSLEERNFIRLGDSEWGTKKITILDKWAENMETYRSPDERQRSPHERAPSPGEPKKNNIRRPYKEYGEFDKFWDGEA